MCIFKVTNIPNNNRLAVMGVLKGTTFRIVKRVAGMIQIRFWNSDLVMREDVFSEVEYNREVPKVNIPKQIRKKEER